MPIKIPRDLPASKILEEENVFVMSEDRASRQDIRALKIAVVNLMPTKITTETQLLRLLANTPLQVDITLVEISGHICRNTSMEHLERFYTSSKELITHRFDGLIVTGAPLEQVDFTQVDYWGELCAVMEWARDNVYSTLYICWGALAGLYYNHGVKKVLLPKKISGVFPHTLTPQGLKEPLLRGVDDIFYIPHSRYGAVQRLDINANKDLVLLSTSNEAGVAIVRSRDRREVYITGHLEYDSDTLAKEYRRDVDKGINPAIPEHYFPNDDPNEPPLCIWRSSAHLFFSNWLNYYVYQGTPYKWTSTSDDI